MILYIDETETEDFFIVAGLLVNDPVDVQKAYKKFKKKVQNISIPVKYKSRVFTEFKSVLLDRDYSRIKWHMLEEIRELGGAIIYSCQVKKTPRMNQFVKESLYITLLASIFGELSCETSVIFDRFGIQDFEKKIIRSAESNPHITEIHPKDSQTEPGLQFVDNICSVIRLHKSEKDMHGFYSAIEKMIREV